MQTDTLGNEKQKRRISAPPLNPCNLFKPPVPPKPPHLAKLLGTKSSSSVLIPPCTKS